MTENCSASPEFGLGCNIDPTQLQNFDIKIVDARKNRSLVGKKPFRKGEVLFSEKPLVSSQFAWNEFYKYKACEFCMKPLETAEENVRRLAETNTISLPYLGQCCQTDKTTKVACPQCEIEYCSESCRSQAFHLYHQSLCIGEQRKNPDFPLNVLMDIWKQIHLPPETTTIYLILKLIAMIKQAPNKTVLMQKIENFECSLVNEQEKIPHKLLEEKYFNGLEGMRELTLELFNNFLFVKECEPWLTKEGFRRIFSLFGRNSQGIGTSPFSVYVENVSHLRTINKLEKRKVDKLIDKIYAKLDKTAGSFLNSEGSGLYEVQSMINHSCAPNAEITFKHNTSQITIVALSDIQPGEEVTISYLDECELTRSRHSRQKTLRENYLFTCDCERCRAEADQADVTSDEDEELEEEDDDDEYEDIEDDEDEDKNDNEQSMEN